VEKFTNAYEESIHIPLIVSNPKLHVCSQETHSLISVLDIVPPVAYLLGVSGAFVFYRTSLVEVLDNPRMCPNEMVHFTYNDIPSRNAPSIIRCVRTLRYKYDALYISHLTATTPTGNSMIYKVDPDEDYNVAGQSRYGDIELELETL
jgi:arylsulfatase A-like enzyme